MREFGITVGTYANKFTPPERLIIKDSGVWPMYGLVFEIEITVRCFKIIVNLHYGAIIIW